MSLTHSTRRFHVVAAHALALFAAFAPIQAELAPTSPEAFFGYRLGADGRIARWDRIVSYFELLERQSEGRLRVLDMGPTTMGNPFLLVIVSSRNNLAHLDELRAVNVRLADPRGLGPVEIDRLVARGRVVICQSMSLHATEIGGTQMAPELACDLLSRTDEEAARILDNVIFLLVPSFNPDGQVMVTDWYHTYRGSAHDGAALPWLYHKYAGHDNNRDAFQTNLVESRYMARILFREWVPQAYVDHHHQDSYGPRIYIPPYAEPVRPLADPLVWREMSWYGAHMACKEEEAGMSGVLNNAIYSGWGHFGFHWITPFHNIAGMLTESAGTRLASPIFIHPDQLRGGRRGMPVYEEQLSFPNPWPGGWWRLRDIVERQKIAAWAALDLAARNRETILRNAYLKAMRQTARGAAGKPAAYAIPPAQHDPLTAAKLVHQLLTQGIEVRRSRAGFTTAEGMHYAPGTCVVTLAQPKMGLIRHLLGQTRYPDNEWTRARDGTPIPPYDMATDTMSEFMGVRVDPLNVDAPGDPVTLGAVPPPFPGPPAAARAGAGQIGSAHLLDGRLNDSMKAVNMLIDNGLHVTRADRAAPGVRPGDFVVDRIPTPLLERVVRETGVMPVPVRAPVAPDGLHVVKRLRIGIYQRYRGGNADEGWTRLLLEQFGFTFQTLLDADLVKKEGLNVRCDVIVLPHDSTGALVGDRGADAMRRDAAIPPGYRSGFGAPGTQALDAFVRKGGTLVTLGAASNFAIDKLGVPVRNATAGKTPLQFWCPGSTLEARFDNTHPLGYGMPDTGLLVYSLGSCAFEIVPGDHNERCETVVRYAERHLLRSGWLLGEETLANKPAMVSVQLDAGRVVMIGFRAQHRAQTHGTYKLLFNALLP